MNVVAPHPVHARVDRCPKGAEGCLGRARVGRRRAQHASDHQTAGSMRGDCERGDSNPHGLPRQNLNLVRLPIPPLSPGLGRSYHSRERVWRAGTG